MASRRNALVRHGIVQIPAGRRVFQQLTVLQNLEMGAFTRSDKDGIGHDLQGMMAHFPTLARKAGARAGSLSGGEQQILAIARGSDGAPAQAAPGRRAFSRWSFAAHGRFEVFSFLAEMTAEGMSLVLAEQNVRKALSITNQAIVLAQGAIVAQMASDALLSDADFRRARISAPSEGSASAPAAA